MVRTASTMLALGTKAPSFALSDTQKAANGKVVSNADFAGKPMLVIFLCNHCPYVKHVASEIARIAVEYQAKGVGIVGISSNDVSSHPDDGPEKMTAEAQAQGYTFPYLFDGKQEVAQAYRAACTPDFFLFDAAHRLVYRGQLDDSRPKNGLPLTGADLRAALDAVLSGKPVAEKQKPSIGCNIKWAAGQEPEYFDPVGVTG
jgi:peroxiredoxin